jgi:hypothetical protein
MKHSTQASRFLGFPKSFKPLLITAIAASGAFHFLTPVLADGTAAGANIVNRATATYSDGTTDFDAVSNEVTIVVAEVRGLTVTDAGFTDDNGGNIATGDTLFFDFQIANTGNSDAYVYIPGATALGGLATGGTITGVEITAVTVNGVAQGTSIAVPDAGDSTENLTGTGFTDGILGADDTITVRVTMEVTATTNGEQITVQFGDTSDNNTPPADGSQNQQNIRDDSDTGSNNTDVRTLDSDATPPANGAREAAASHSETLGIATRPLAQATALMTSTTTQGPDISDASDDTITYDLGLRVENNNPSGYPAGSSVGI